jgi:Dolichyl-phosphate-mannose-protein mannosyltransferase
MDEANPTAQPARGFNRTDLACVLLLAAAATGIRAWQLTHTAVASRDSIGYSRIAWRLEHGDWRKVIPHAAQHPLYPAALLAVSWPVRHYLPDDLPFAMQLSAQLTSAIAGILLVLPCFLLGRELFDRRVGFGGSFLFQCLPSSGRVLGDGLSEAVFLLFAAWSLYLAVRALRGRSPVPFALAGLASGLAYLTRPEGLIIAATTGFVLVATQCVQRWRRPWRNVFSCAAALVVATLVAGAPYMILIRGLTVKQAANRVWQKVQQVDGGANVLARDNRVASLGVGLPLFAEWSDPNPDEHVPSERRLWGVIAVANMVIRGFFWSSWLPAVVALWVRRDRFREVPGMWMVPLLCGLIAVSLYSVAVVVGYASDRHLLLIILLGCFWAAAGIPLLAAGISALLQRLHPALARWRWCSAASWTAGLWVLLCVAPLVKTLETLHADRAGFRQAGYWLAQHAWTGDEIDDAYAWANFYAGHVFTEVDPGDGLPNGPGPAHEPKVRYVVLEESGNKHPRLQKNDPQDLLNQGGRVEQKWTLSHRKDNAVVAVYVVPVSATNQN